VHGEVALSKSEDYHSYNTVILDVEGIKGVLRKLEEISKDLI